MKSAFIYIGMSIMTFMTASGKIYTLAEEDQAFAKAKEQEKSVAYVLG